jgi:hypothetical protein
VWKKVESREDKRVEEMMYYDTILNEFPEHKKSFPSSFLSFP